MKSIFRAILNFGVVNEQSEQDKRRVKTINLLNAVMLFFLLMGLTNYFFLGKGFPLIPEVTFILLSTLSLVLSYLNKTQTAFVIFTLNANGSTFFINQYFPFETGSYLYYFPLIVSIILLNNVAAKNRYAVLHFSISALFFLLYLLLDFPGWRIQEITPETVKVLWYYNICISVVITVLVSGLLNRLIAVQNQEILKQNQILNLAKEEINESLREKEVLLAELNHRVKNNLAIITGLLSLQNESTMNTEAKQIIFDSKNRILSMALVHKMLYEHPKLKNIDIGIYSNNLIKELLHSSNLNDQVEVTEYYDTINLPVDKSIPFGLILNEIITNSIKYVFKERLMNKARFDITINKMNNHVVMVARDSGEGFPKDMNAEDNSLSLGIFLIKSLAEQLDGKVHFSNDNGAKIELKFILN